MMKIVLVCALVAVAAGANLPVPRLDGRIVGGRDADITEFPHQVSLQFYGSHGCGASIISPNYVVTAAHCTDGVSASILSIRAGSTRHSSGGQLVYVKNIFQNPKYNSRTIDYDISILELSSELQYNDGVQPIGLPSENQNVAVGSTVTVSGWGTTTEGGSIPSNLKAVDLRIIGHSDCNDAYYPSYQITDRMLCAGVGGGKDACQGDSGGPLVQGHQLVGVVSWGIGCARPNYPGVFASVSNLRNYITQITGI